jgi:hypothetical protein
VSTSQPHNDGPTSGQAQRSSGGTATASAPSLHDPNTVPPASEDIHLPPGTPIPLAIAVGITLILVGTTVNWLWTIIGGIIFMVALVLWIRDTRREVDHLPDEHGSPAHH